MGESPTRKKEKRNARLEGHETEQRRMNISNLSETFKLGEMFFNNNQSRKCNKGFEALAVIISQNTPLSRQLVYPCPPRFKLSNWEIKKTSKVPKGLPK